MNEIQDIFNKNSDISVKEILSHSGEQNKKKLLTADFPINQYSVPLNTGEVIFFSRLLFLKNRKRRLGKVVFSVVQNQLLTIMII